MFYFAYGSNLNMRQMSVRCPAADMISRSTLADYQLVFRGVADIIPAEGGTVHGGLWRITPECLISLDRYEGVRNGLYRRVNVTVRVGSRKVSAMTYRMNRGEFGPPSETYLDTIIHGYRDFRLSSRSLRDAVVYTGNMMDAEQNGRMG